MISNDEKNIIYLLFLFFYIIIYKNELKKIICENERLIIKYIDINPRNLSNIDKKYYTFNVLLCAVKKDGYMIKYATDELINNKILIETALKQTHYAYNYLNKNLKTIEFIKECIEINPKILTILSKEDKKLLEND